MVGCGWWVLVSPVGLGVVLVFLSFAVALTSWLYIPALLALRLTPPPKPDSVKPALGPPSERELRGSF